MVDINTTVMEPDGVTRDYMWIVQNNGDGHVKVDIGDRFEPSHLFDEPVQQVGADMLIKALQFLGATESDKRLLFPFIMSHLASGGTNVITDDEY